ncbi:hypothetical protein LQ938_02850 [Microbacterium sp. cx-55]|uniref:hypothetical protein n=1 Tax=Microbacterium sp. cx-55 TaxID=2875948 RepID=UPI001CBB8D8B|nr:hypothetical protein [Microbacterium sp. cx-55]MBZ4486827.1 hypothetical protein [Microbacterium sp. cx-55]UGB35756.1 hypothetical protein LQ938_02850 [Microbacterium sp. cx-55]
MPERISPTRLRRRRLAAIIAAAIAVFAATYVAAPAAPATYGARSLTVDDPGNRRCISS